MIYVVSKQVEGRWLITVVCPDSSRRADHHLESIGTVCGWLIDNAPPSYLVIALNGRNQLDAIFGDDHGITIV